MEQGQYYLYGDRCREGLPSCGKPCIVASVGEVQEGTGVCFFKTIPPPKRRASKARKVCPARAILIWGVDDVPEPRAFVVRRELERKALITAAKNGNHFMKQ